MRRKFWYYGVDLLLFLALYAVIGHSLPWWRAVLLGVVVSLFQQLGTSAIRRVWR